MFQLRISKINPFIVKMNVEIRKLVEPLMLQFMTPPFFPFPIFLNEILSHLRAVDCHTNLCLQQVAHGVV